MSTKYFLFSVVFIRGKKNLQFLLKQNTYGFPELQTLPGAAAFPQQPSLRFISLVPSSHIQYVFSETYSVHFIKQIQVKMNTFILTEMMIFSLWDY